MRPFQFNFRYLNTTYTFFRVISQTTLSQFLCLFVFLAIDSLIEEIFMSDYPVPVTVRYEGSNDETKHIVTLRSNGRKK